MNVRSNSALILSKYATVIRIFGVIIFQVIICWIQKQFIRQVKSPFSYMQSDIYESHCSPISSDHSASPLSELTSAEHIVAISLAWGMISILICCWGCCPVHAGTHSMREGIIVTCHHSSVIVPEVSVAPSGPLSLCLALNSWLPWKNVWCMLVWSPVQGQLIHNVLFNSYFIILNFCMSWYNICMYVSLVARSHRLTPNRLHESSSCNQTAQFLVNQQCWY